SRWPHPMLGEGYDTRTSFCLVVTNFRTVRPLIAAHWSSGSLRRGARRRAEDAGEKAAVIGGGLDAHPVVAGDRVGSGAQGAQAEDYFAHKRPGHRQPGIAVANRPVALDDKRTAGQIAADRAGGEG